MSTCRGTHKIEPRFPKRVWMEKLSAGNRPRRGEWRKGAKRGERVKKKAKLSEHKPE